MNTISKPDQRSIVIVAYYVSTAIAYAHSGMTFDAGRCVGQALVHAVQIDDEGARERAQLLTDTAERVARGI